jgi:hypothetical protein
MPDVGLRSQVPGPAPSEAGAAISSRYIFDWRLTPSAQKLDRMSLTLGDRTRALLFRQPGFGYGSAHGDVDATMFQNRLLAAAVAGLAAGLAIPSVNGDGQESKTAITCTNPMSGTSWQIAIDFDRATVDSNQAEITDAKIAWFDPTDGSNYTLDRKSGALTAIVASSTGGYFRHGRCSLEKSR